MKIVPGKISDDSGEESRFGVGWARGGGPVRTGFCGNPGLQRWATGISLAVQWLRLYFQCRGHKFDPWSGKYSIKILHGMQHDQKRERQREMGCNETVNMRKGKSGIFLNIGNIRTC